MPGDVNQSGGVTIQDVLNVVSKQGSSTSAPANYSIFDDVNGSGSITIQDVLATNSFVGSSLPAGTPTEPTIVIQTANPVLQSATSTALLKKKHHIADALLETH